MTRPALDELCAAAGIERVYRDQFGERREVDEETIRALLSAIGLEIDTSGLGSQLAKPQPAPLAPVTVALIENGSVSVTITLPADQNDTPVAWNIVEESGAGHTGTLAFKELELVEVPSVGNQVCERRRLSLPSLPLGYHRLSVRFRKGTDALEACLIVAPERAYMPAMLSTGPGLWGIAVQLYSLRSPEDWGIGDFGAFAEFLRRATSAGAAAVGVNPLHALYVDEPEWASPYSPNSRIFLNPLYIDVPAVPEFGETEEAATLFASTEFQSDLARVQAAALVDYPAVANLKRRMLEVLHRSFHRRHIATASPRAASFAAFVRAEGEALRRFCIFQAMRETFGARDPEQRHWHNWPEAYRDPSAPAVTAFAADHDTVIEFFAYLQWIAHQQLERCAIIAKEAGMPVGLYRDLAVGVDSGSADSWLSQHIIARDWNIGAPPDNWNRKGQNWGLSPVNPIALRRDCYRSFIALIRANMRHAGALRIDHILGLWRTFWIPQGKDPAHGAYLRNPFADLVAIIALESRRARCMVIGEDLGTLPDGLQDALQRTGILSYRLFYFERDADGSCRQPASYPRQALVAVGTHDLPTLPGFWRGADLRLRADLGFLADSAAIVEARARRADDIGRLTEVIRAAGLIGDGTPTEPPVIEAYRFLARTESRVLMVQVEDALGVVDQVNVPGTVDEYPNWRRRLPLDVGAIFRDAAFSALCEALAVARPLPERRHS